MIGMTGADLRNLANEAALLATREDKNKIDRTDFERAADRVLIGPKREEVLTADEKRAHRLPRGRPRPRRLAASRRPIRRMKVSIIPRGQARRRDPVRPRTRTASITASTTSRPSWSMTMGGRAADRLIYGQPYAGAENGPEAGDAAGPLHGDALGHERPARPDVLPHRRGARLPRQGDPGAARLQRRRPPHVIDEEVQRLLREADERAYDLLEKNRADLDRLVEALLQNEELQREEIDDLLKRNKNIQDGKPTNETLAPTLSSAVSLATLRRGVAAKTLL